MDYEKDHLNDIYSTFIQILRQVMAKMTSSHDPKLRQLVPNPEI